MSSSKSSLPFRSKKPLKLKPNKLESEEFDPLSAKTPEKNQSSEPNRRSRNQNVALSLAEVRKAAERLRKPSGDRADQMIVSAKRKIVDFPDERGDSSAVKHKSRAHGGHKLPEKYEILCEFFRSLDSSIRLLRIKGSTQSFTNICLKIECLTDRRFTYSHLAQMKFILPEVIEIKRTLVFDERSSCMKPDLHITMNVGALDCGEKLKSEDPNMCMKRVFRSRLVEFSKTHPEDQEVPEEALPEPFNIRKQVVYPEPKTNLSFLPKASPKAKNQQPVVATHFPSTFQRRFSQKIKSNELENTLDKSSGISVEGNSPEQAVKVNATPRKELYISKKEETTTKEDVSSHNTPAKLDSTPARLMTSTPGLCPPKRSYMTPENDSVGSPNKLVRRPPRTRSLKFDSPMKKSNVNDVEDYDKDSINEEILDILPESLLQSIRENERIAREESDPAISQAKRRKQMIARLPKTFNMIHFMFQSINRCVITKDELIHKIISSQSDIVDKKEVEEQLDLLLELVPDWISEKLASGGGLLLRINKMTSPDSVRLRLTEAE